VSGESKLISVAQLLRHFRVTTFDFAQFVRRGAVEKVGPVSCSPECAYCCYQKIVGPTFVGVMIYLYLRHERMWTPALRARLVEADRQMTARTHRGSLMARRPCPFLKEQSFGRGACSIYPVRPSACGSTFSVTKDPTRCAEVDTSNQFTINSDAATATLLPFVMATARWAEPAVITTLPGSVLLAEARVEGLPEPELLRLEMPRDEGAADWVEREFDSYATVPDGE
jgi:Fe-S-cluster containining protein